LKGAAALGAAVLGEPVDLGGAPAALSFAARRAVGFLARKGGES
jgi:hypothetical protein